MFGEIGIEKILLVLVIVLLLFGAKRIPELAGSMGKGIREFKRSLSDPDRTAGGGAVGQGGDASAGATRSGEPAERVAAPAPAPPVARDEGSADPKRLIR